MSTLSLPKVAWQLFVVLLFSSLAFAQHYMQTNLVSDISGMAAVTDPNLKNPWGLARSASSPWWAADNTTGLSTLYNGMGEIQPLVVTVPPPPDASGPAAPDGMVFNGTGGFDVALGKSAIFVFVTEDGTISGWNPGANATNAILVINHSPKAVYKGATISEVRGADYLYVTNFRENRVEVYDTKFNRVRLSRDAFEDRYLPEGFAPFNIQAIGRNIYVTYARQDAEKHDDVAGTGFGFVDIYSPSGKLRGRLEHGPWFNSPWGVVLTPGEFGTFSHSLLVGNFGSGEIAAFNPVTGRFQGMVRNLDNSILAIDGLWALAFGNNGGAGPSNTLFFSAGPNGEQDGLFGTLTPVAAELNREDVP